MAGFPTDAPYNDHNAGSIVVIIIIGVFAVTVTAFISSRKKEFNSCSKKNYSSGSSTSSTSTADSTVTSSASHPSPDRKVTIAALVKAGRVRDWLTPGKNAKTDFRNLLEANGGCWTGDTAQWLASGGLQEKLTDGSIMDALPENPEAMVFIVLTCQTNDPIPPRERWAMGMFLAKQANVILDVRKYNGAPLGADFK